MDSEPMWGGRAAKGHTGSVMEQGTGDAGPPSPWLKQRRWRILAGAFLVCVMAAPLASAQQPLVPHGGEQGYIVYLPLPPEVTPDALLQPSESVRERLHRLVRERLAQEERVAEAGSAVDRIIVFTDQAGRLILPDLEAARARHSKPDGLPAPAPPAGNELIFTFNSPEAPWSAAEIATLNTTLADCYPVAKAIYGPPAFNITVNVRKDPAMFAEYAGTYNPSLNEIALRTAAYSADVVCHEMIHAFRDDNVIHFSRFEEGMTRAVEVEVFNRLPQYAHFDKHHSYTYDVYYEGLNRRAIGSQGGNFFLGYISFFLRYQLAGYAWGKALLENPNFLADFNGILYTRTLSDLTTTTTESKLLEIAGTVQTTVEGKPFRTWYGQQGVLDTNPPKGYSLYQRINQFTVDYFRRDPSGFETMQSNAIIQWRIYDDRDTLLDNGTDGTSTGGWIWFNPRLPIGYAGRIKVVTTTSTPGGTIDDTSLRSAGSENGIFGIVETGSSGTLTITPLDDPASPLL